MLPVKARGRAPVVRIEAPPVVGTLDVAPLRVIDRGGQCTGRTRPTCALGGARDEQADHCCHLGEGHCGHACRRGPRRPRPAGRSRNRPGGAGRPGSAPGDRKDQSPVGARGRAVGQSGDRAGAASGRAARQLRRGRLYHDVMRRPARRVRAPDPLPAHPQRRVDDDDERRAHRTPGDVRAVRRHSAGAAPAHRVHFHQRDRLLPVDHRACGPSAGDRIDLPRAGGPGALPYGLRLSGVIRRAAQQPAVR
jgi:hypothetical protein